MDDLAVTPLAVAVWTAVVVGITVMAAPTRIAVGVATGWAVLIATWTAAHHLTRRQ